MKLEQIVGDNIRHLRERKNWIQEDLAINAKVTRTYIGLIERGKKSLTLGKLALIAKALKVEPHSLLIDGFYRLSQTEE